MIKWIYLVPLKSVLNRSILHYYCKLGTNNFFLFHFPLPSANITRRHIRNDWFFDSLISKNNCCEEVGVRKTELLKKALVLEKWLLRKNNCCVEVVILKKREELVWKEGVLKKLLNIRDGKLYYEKKSDITLVIKFTWNHFPRRITSPWSGWPEPTEKECAFRNALPSEMFKVLSQTKKLSQFLLLSVNISLWRLASALNWIVYFQYPP